MITGLLKFTIKNNSILNNGDNRTFKNGHRLSTLFINIFTKQNPSI